VDERNEKRPIVDIADDVIDDRSWNADPKVRAAVKELLNQTRKDPHFFSRMVFVVGVVAGINPDIHRRVGQIAEQSMGIAWPQTKARLELAVAQLREPYDPANTVKH